MRKMRILKWDDFLLMRPEETSQVSMSIGVFDGVHKGHEALIKSILSVNDLSPWIITFKDSPDRVFNSKDYPGDLMTYGQKLKKLASFGIETTVIIDFSQEFGKLSGAVFLDLIRKHCVLRYLAVGEDFHCGNNMDTGAKAAKTFLEPAGIFVNIVPPVFQEGSIISSTRIRRAVEKGDFTSAEKMLGHPYVLLPASGDKTTVNGPVRILKSAISQVLPKKGRYPVMFHSGNGRKKGLVDIDEEVISWHYSGIVEAITFI
jgi:riboflavin kinase/FMN adenylyltransferase